MANYKVLGITDTNTTCDCCGRRGLKRTVALDRLDADENTTGDVVYFGTDCAAKAITPTTNLTHRKNAELIATLGRAMEYAKKWLRSTERHTAAVIAQGLWNSHKSFARVEIVGEYAVKFENGVVIKR
jgi:hypothetical protein